MQAVANDKMAVAWKERLAEQTRKAEASSGWRARVYISGPITQGDRNDNVSAAVDVYKYLISRGYAPFCPHLSHYAEANHDCVFDHATWIEIDLPWVDMSHAILRLPGPSKGADLEVARAREIGIPVFGTLAELEVWRNDQDSEPPKKPTSTVPAKVKGVSPDAPTIVAANGAKQSDCPYAPDLYDAQALLEVSAVLKRGADKYGVDNWRGLTTNDHLRHMLTHIYAHLAGDTTDNHLANAHCRAMFAHASVIASRGPDAP